MRSFTVLMITFWNFPFGCERGVRGCCVSAPSCGPSFTQTIPWTEPPVCIRLSYGRRLSLARTIATITDVDRAYASHRHGAADGKATSQDSGPLLPGHGIISLVS